MLRTAILWTHDSHYLQRLAVEFADQAGPTLLVTMGRGPSAPFGSLPIHDRLAMSRLPADWHDLASQLEDFKPDVLLVAGWAIPQYRRVAQRFKGQCLRIMSMDNQWRGTLKQYAGIGIFRTAYRRMIDYALTPGPRQAQFASNLGFRDRLIQGGLPCDVNLFTTSRPPGRHFFTLCRLSSEKGIDHLLNAYARYRASASDPWDLRVAGAGQPPSEHPDGVTFLGFLDPAGAASAMADAGAFVLASSFEPWGVVLQEAAAAGRPIIATDVCGATGVMAVDGLNAIIVPSGDVEALEKSMLHLSALTQQQLQDMGGRGTELARVQTAQTLVDHVQQLHRAQRHSSDGAFSSKGSDRK